MILDVDGYPLVETLSLPNANAIILAGDGDSFRECAKLLKATHPDVKGSHLLVCVADSFPNARAEILRKSGKSDDTIQIMRIPSEGNIMSFLHAVVLVTGQGVKASRNYIPQLGPQNVIHQGLELVYRPGDKIHGREKEKTEIHDAVWAPMPFRKIGLVLSTLICWAPKAEWI